VPILVPIEMRPFRLIRYAVVAVVFLGLSVNLAFRPPVTASVVGFFVALTLAALVASRTTTDRLSWVVRGSLVLAVIEFFVEWGWALHKGYSDSGCTPQTCGEPAWIAAIAPSLWAFAGATALIVVVSDLTRRRSRRADERGTAASA
jgi:hypothetical protein